MTAKALRRALALYYGLISQIDAQIGRILNRLEELSLSNNTIVIFTSDHGDFAGDHGIIDKGVPTLDGIWRVPFLISDPRDISNKGVVRDQLINLIDLMPTLYEKIGLDLPKGVEGKSFVREISESNWNGRTSEFYEFRHVKTVRTREFVMSYCSPGEEGYKEYEHSTCAWASGGELYDLKIDPNQFNNLYDDIAYREVRLSLTEKLLEWFCNTERVHRSTIVKSPRNPMANFDFNGMSEKDYHKNYLANHPLL